MRETIRRRLPGAYAWLRARYMHSRRYRNALNRARAAALEAQTNERLADAAMVSRYLAGSYVVNNGPFRGMRYLPNASGSALLPKLLGSYEEPIQEWIERLIHEDSHHTIVNIGCAEGYYAVGFARALPARQVVGYDIDGEARQRTAELAAHNGMANVSVAGECDAKELGIRAGRGSLILCDVEGFEDTLLDPVLCPPLRETDILVECHDFLVPDVTERIIGRFWKTHVIRVAVDYPFRTRKYQTPVGTLDAAEFSRLTDERRPPRMRFLLLTAK